MTIAACIVYVLILLAVVGWVLYEIWLDGLDRRDRIEPTVPAPRERMPPKDGL